MSERQQQLLNHCLDYLLEHGVAELSLRPLAAAVGTSARLLVYHFGSKEGLLIAVMDQLRERMQASFRALSADARMRRSNPLDAFWQWATRREQLRRLRLLFEVQALALHHPAKYARYLEQASASWLPLIDAALPPSRRSPALATLCAAAVDGLLLELLSSGDRRRTTAALKLFGELLHDGVKHETNR
jgi:AcrR family transcriptional regulator